MSEFIPQPLERTREFEPSYQLQDAKVTELSQLLLHENSPMTNGRFSCHLVDGSSEYSNLARNVESTVFNRFFGNTPEQLTEQYGQYEAASSFFLVMDSESQKPAGALRIIRNSDKGLKTLNDIADDGPKVSADEFQQYHGVEYLDECWDIGTVAVLDEFRKKRMQLVSNMLYRGMHVRALHEGIKHYTSIIDTHASKTFDLLGIPFTPIVGCKPFPYLGSEASTAVYGDTSDFIEGVLRKHQEMKETERMKSLVFYLFVGRLAHGQGIDDNLTFDYK